MIIKGSTENFKQALPLETLGIHGTSKKTAVTKKKQEQNPPACATITKLGHGGTSNETGDISDLAESWCGGTNVKSAGAMTGLHVGIRKRTLVKGTPNTIVPSIGDSRETLRACAPIYSFDGCNDRIQGWLLLHFLHHTIELFHKVVCPCTKIIIRSKSKLLLDAFQHVALELLRMLVAGVKSTKYGTSNIIGTNLGQTWHWNCLESWASNLTDGCPG